jgi:hypothetical protein
MHDYQVKMGDIQDLEVLIACLDELAAKLGKKKADQRWQPARQQLVGRCADLVKAYCNSADELLTFWPPPKEIES